MKLQLQLLTVPEVATALQVSDRTIERLVAGGELPTVRIGAAVRFEPAAVENFIREGGTAKRESQVVL